MYEWERIRGMAYGINAYLPEDSRVLYIRITVENTSGNDTWSYWWSNGAVNETEKTRIIVPTNETFTSLYDHDGTRILDKIPYPEVDGYDASYPIKGPRSRDYFYCIPKDAPERWEASAEPDGKGALQMSTHELLGRKLFLWGTTIGGRNWSEFLGSEGDHYTETQAGKAYTQFEHVPMAANETWQWTEGYAALECDPVKTHGTWEEAKAAVEDYIHNDLGIKDVEGTLRNIVPTEFVSYETVRHGSGFGALEELMDGKRLSAFYDYSPESMDGLQFPWRQLLDQGYLDEPDVTAAVYTYISGEKWIELLEKSLEKPEADHWYTYYQLATAYFAAEQTDKSRAAYEKSVEKKENPWALRCLSVLADNKGDKAEALRLIEKAVSFGVDCVNLYIEYATLLVEAGEFGRLIELYPTFPEAARKRERIRLQLARAFMALERYDDATDIINPSFVLPDVREGEVSLSDLWFDLYLRIVKKELPDLSDDEAISLRDERYPLPKQLDFRMAPMKKK
jgi:tetratricopeptide (TPR) repeat protein